MAEWLKAHAWKACLLEKVTWVRIPLSPPLLLLSGTCKPMIPALIRESLVSEIQAKGGRASFDLSPGVALSTAEECDDRPEDTCENQKIPVPTMKMANARPNNYSRARDDAAADASRAINSKPIFFCFPGKTSELGNGGESIVGLLSSDLGVCEIEAVFQGIRKETK